MRGSAEGATAPKQEWLRGHGTDQGEHVFEGFQTRDGGYIAVGKTGENSGRTTDILVVKTDAAGNLEWQRVIGEKGSHEEGRCVIEAADGYIVGGALQSKAGLLKLDGEGVTLWSKTYPHAGFGAIRGIELAGDNEIVATGYPDSKEREVPFIAEEAKGFILKTDADGTLIWKKPLGVTQGTKVKKAKGGLLVCSTAWRVSDGIDHQDACLIRTDDEGNEVWTKYYGGAGDDQCFDMDLAADGCVLGGHTRSGSGWDAWAVRVDSDGKLMWEKKFGEPLGGDSKVIFDECYGIKTTPDGGFVMACGSGIEPDNTVNKTDPLNTWAAYIVRTDAAGETLWTFTHHTPGEGHNAAEYVGACRDGS